METSAVLFAGEEKLGQVITATAALSGPGLTALFTVRRNNSNRMATAGYTLKLNCILENSFIARERECELRGGRAAAAGGAGEVRGARLQDEHRYCGQRGQPGRLPQVSHPLLLCCTQLWRMDGAWLGSTDIAVKKAKTAVFFQMNTETIGSLSQVKPG